MEVYVQDRAWRALVLRSILPKLRRRQLDSSITATAIASTITSRVYLNWCTPHGLVIYGTVLRIGNYTNIREPEVGGAKEFPWASC